MGETELRVITVTFIKVLIGDKDHVVNKENIKTYTS